MERCSLARGDGRRTCRTCGGPLPRGRHPACSVECADRWAVQHSWPRARIAALERDGLVCRQCGLPTLEPEVHHDIPVGRHGYRPGCVHHQSNLRTLCPPCHRGEDTFRRRAERLLAATGTGPTVQMVLPGIAA